jgi:hypothetical protein
MSKALRVACCVTFVGLAAFCVKAADEDKFKPPKDAVILFDGKSAEAWVHRGSKKPCEWVVKDGYMQVKGGDIQTKETFADFQLHLEFWLPWYPARVEGQARANSGVYLQGRYEIQILDSFVNPTYKAGGCGAIYGQKDPDNFAEAVRLPERWNTYDITFRAPRFDSEGKLLSKPRITAFWNGVKIHDNVEIEGFNTTAGAGGDPKTPGPIMLQDHGSPIRFRNIWIVPLRDK